MSIFQHNGKGWDKIPMARDNNPLDAFLCCPGPSLIDIPRHHGRTVYAINTAYPKIQPDVWIGMDRVACYDSRLWGESFMKILRWIPGDTQRAESLPNTFFAGVEYAKAEEMFARRGNATRFVWTKSTLMLALHFIIWRGHKRIYFVGCDMGGSSLFPGADYHDERVLTPTQRVGNRLLYAEQAMQLLALYPMAQERGIEFISCTPNSILNTFMPFVPAPIAMNTGDPVQNLLLHCDDAEKVA